MIIARTTKGLALLAASALMAFSQSPQPTTPEERFEFGEVMSGTVVEHDFVLKNQGSAPLLIREVRMTPPLLVTQMPREVAAGAEDRIHLKLDTANLAGKFEGTIWVVFDGPAKPQAVLTVAGTIAPTIVLSPMRAFFVAGQRGRGGRAAIEIVNREAAPLALGKIEHPTERFTTELETLEPGQRYRLTLTLKPDGPGGRAADTILIGTSSKTIPSLQVAANTYLYEKVRTSPEVLDFGTLHAADAGREALTLMIYREGGSDFQVKLSSDVPALDLKYERGPKGDRYQATIRLLGDKIRPGPIEGAISIETNDPEFRKLSVPFHGIILP